MNTLTLAATHTHTGNDHTHTLPTHTHPLSTSGNPDTVGLAVNVFTTPFSGSTHGHNLGTSEASSAATLSNTTPTHGSSAMQPSSRRAIIIKPDDANQKVPVDGIVLTFSSSYGAAENMQLMDGTGGTNDMDGRFFIGAQAAGDGGGTLGSTTHDHTTTAHSHTGGNHTQRS